MAEPKKVIVTWLDSTQTHPGWQDIDAVLEAVADDPPCPLTSVGFYIGERSGHSIFANSYNPQADQVEGIHTIPTVAITGMIEWK